MFSDMVRLQKHLKGQKASKTLFEMAQNVKKTYLDSLQMDQTDTPVLDPSLNVYYCLRDHVCVQINAVEDSERSGYFVIFKDIRGNFALAQQNISEDSEWFECLELVS